VVSSRLCLLLGNALSERGGFGPFFGRVSEHADMVELSFGDESRQRLELRFGLSRKADDECCPHDGVGKLGSGVLDQAAGHVDVAGSVHRPQHVSVGVLDGHVQIGEQRVMLGHDVNHFEGQQAWIDVQHP
jgi:hypothetical protein